MAVMQPPKLIAPFLRTLQELEAGIRPPRTALQLHFVQVCKGAAVPKTAHERAYLQWRVQVQRRVGQTSKKPSPQRPFRPVRPDDAAAAPASPPAGRWPDPKPYARFVFEPIGSRDDFKTDSGANYANSRRNKF